MTLSQIRQTIPAMIAIAVVLSAFSGCATMSEETLPARLSAMSDDELVSYYQGINDRLKAIQQGTREADSQGTVLAQDELAKIPYLIGGEAWELEQTRKQVGRELVHRHLTP